jgi:sporulation protein YlmC with PRC-barrel domain
MLKEVTELVGLHTYTPKGKYLGVIKDVILDTEKSEVYEILLTSTNPELVENSRDIQVPYRWVSHMGDILMLRYFPGKIKLKRRGRARHRKMRVRKMRWGEGGVSRLPWR